ncbi:MAG: ATP-binding cassette domain-containing protein [Pirellulales bacterium]
MNATAPATTAPADAAAPPLLRVASLSVRFGTQQVLRDISVDLAPGDTLVVLGESGCGKTVLLKSMIGLVRPSGGDVLFEGRSLSRMSDRQLATLRTRYGFVFQGAALFDSLTIADNIAFPLREHTRIPAAEVRAITESLVAEVGLPRSVLTKKPVELSGGMRKRAGLARALALDPTVVLYDEPTTGLDPIMTDVINELILRVRRPNVTSVVVTHDMNTARKVADRVIMLYPLFRLRPGESQIVFDGTPEELDRSGDPRIQQFIEGRAGARLMELREEQARSEAAGESDDGVDEAAGEETA